MIHRTLFQLKRVKVVIPPLSPTLSKAKIYKWLKEPSLSTKIECYEPLFVLQCSPDLLSPGYRKEEHHEPLMLIEAHDEGNLQISPEVLESSQNGAWFPVGHFLGTIDDEDDDDNEARKSSHEKDAEWLWQAYSYEETEDIHKRQDDDDEAKLIDNTAYYAPLGMIELKGLLRNRGLDVSGRTREELIDRLVESDNTT